MKLAFLMVPLAIIISFHMPSLVCAQIPQDDYVFIDACTNKSVHFYFSLRTKEKLKRVLIARLSKTPLEKLPHLLCVLSLQNRTVATQKWLTCGIPLARASKNHTHKSDVTIIITK